jgi:hypothetical protein
MSSPVTIKKLERSISRAIAAGVPQEKIDELKSYLQEMKSPNFRHPEPPKPTVQEIERNGKKVVIYSPYPSDKDDFEDRGILEMILFNPYPTLEGLVQYTRPLFCPV